MEYSELSRIIAEATTEALKPLSEEIQSLKTHDNSKKSIPTTQVSQAGKTDWSMWDKVAKHNGYIK